jgi:NAD(P)-dependent dehydrogenase (short-subunit alcohol dehydrogenase family)
MAMEKTRRIAVITGGTDGLGKAAALRLAERGYRVYATGRSAERRSQLETIAQERKLPLAAIEMDVRSDGSVLNAVEHVIGKEGRIDVLVNNAGVGYVAVVEDLKLEDLRQQYETNIFGVLRVTQLVLPGMRARRKGRILMISSVAGLVTPPTYGAYSSSKFALEALSNALRLELHPFRIQVVLIEPGYILTNFQQTARELAAPYAAKAAEGPYAKVYGGAWQGASDARKSSKSTPEDFARVVLRAVEAVHPKARYGVTPLAVFAKWAKRLLSDRMGDRFLRWKYGVPGPE